MHVTVVEMVARNTTVEEEVEEEGAYHAVVAAGEVGSGVVVGEVGCHAVVGVAEMGSWLNVKMVDRVVV